MSSLADIHNNEFAKLPEKSQAVFDSRTATPTTSIEEQSGTSSCVGYPDHLSQALRLKHRPPLTLCSEAALSMMIDCFCP